ncbi:hypothetical protein EUX98_g8847 [Antrodiella citrinella]|uniref:Uncharacterized protein n=1 Tax=Antrodiella citrinella TaxID=2447956 RepID=A0A4S4M1W8_9APHY|nr:hypothetical protein EUX98_g8847 [Antrodiella citrinella]
MTDLTYPLYPITTFLGFIASLIPLFWHLQAWNSGTCFFMMWSALSCLNQFVNAVIWSGNAVNSAPAWCEISTRITIGASVGIPAASLCINRRLYSIARVHAVVIGSAEKRRAILIDSAICGLLPVICMVLAYIVQGHRYDIFEDLGCRPAIYNTIPAYFLVFMWPLVIGVISAAYCCLSLKALFARQAQFNQFLAAGTSLTTSRYFRLMGLAMTDLLLSVPFGIYEIYSNSTGGIQPWLGWADTHFDFDNVNQYPAGEWRASLQTEIPLELNRWLIPACAFIFFAYFGFAEEARKNYWSAWVLVRSRVCKAIPQRREKPVGATTLASSDWLPQYSASSSTTFVASPKTPFEKRSHEPLEKYSRGPFELPLHHSYPLSPTSTTLSQFTDVEHSELESV